MNRIAEQLEYIADELRMTTDILEARQKCRELESAVGRTKPGTDRMIANMKYTSALATVLRLEKQYRETFAPADYVEPSDTPMELKTDETFTPLYRDDADERMEDPRRGQASGINAMIRRPE